MGIGGSIFFFFIIIFQHIPPYIPGHIGYDTAGDWAISREVGGLATDGRVAEASDVLYQINLENEHKPSNPHISATKYIEVFLNLPCLTQYKIPPFFKSPMSNTN